MPEVWTPTVDSRQPASTPHPDAAISRLADRRHGLITYEQLNHLGFDPSAIARRVHAGRLHRHYPGVYSPTPSLPTLEAQLLAAVLACGPDAFLSHRAALVLWRICDPTPGPIDVTAPGRRARSEPRIRHHRTRNLPKTDTTRRQGIPTTTVHRSLIDFASQATERQLQRALDEAAYLRLLNTPSLLAQLSGHQGRRGISTLRRLLEADRPPTRTRSELE